MLKTAFTQGHEAAFARFGVKLARSAAGMPKGPAMHPAMAQLHADLHAAPRAAPAAPAAPHDTGVPHAPIGSLPRSQPAVSNQEAFRNIAQQQAANIQARPAELPPARAFQGQGSAAAGGGTGGVAGGGGGGGGGGWRGGVQQFMRPLKRGLGLAGLAAGGAMLYGMHRNTQQPDERLVYAPMNQGYGQTPSASPGGYY